MAVNYGEAPEVVAAAVEARGYPYLVVLDRAGRTMDPYLVRFRPMTFLLDAEGTVRAVWVGPVPPETLKDAVAALGP